MSDGIWDGMARGESEPLPIKPCECSCGCNAALTEVELKYYWLHPEEHTKLCGKCYSEMRGK